MKKVDAFKRDYEKLLEKHKVTVVGVPEFMPRPDGSWAITIGLKVFEREEEKKEK